MSGVSGGTAGSGEGISGEGDYGALRSSKRSFEFRMSKKVAELTQVVHMLFTRNHEKEVELEALKEAYESEIAEVLADARQRLESAERQLEDLGRQRALEADRIRKAVEEEALVREKELKARLEEGERLVLEERAECQNLRDMLIRAQRDIENLRQGVSQQQSLQEEEKAKREREIDRLKKLVAHLELSIRDSGKESADVIKELRKGNEGLEREVRQVHSALEESERSRELLMGRNKQLENDVKNLRRDFNRKVAEAANSHRTSKSASALSPEQSEELQRLRRELLRYRLELSNREDNFNRMFTEKQPVFVDKTGGAGGPRLFSQSAGSVNAVANGTTNGTTIKREKTMPQIPQTGAGPVIYFEDQPSQFASRQRSQSISVDVRNDSRFPTICSTPELKTRPKQNSASKAELAKPRPLPKQMLSSK